MGCHGLGVFSFVVSVIYTRQVGSLVVIHCGPLCVRVLVWDCWLLGFCTLDLLCLLVW